MARASIAAFLSWAEPHAGADKGKEQWGYVMGGTGQVLTQEILERLAKSAYPSTWRDYVRRGTKWLGRVIADCNGVAEAYLHIALGGNYNTLSRYNYSTWCAGHNGTDMNRMPQQAGTAVFATYGDSTIDHVGFLLRKYGPGPRDWLVLEAKGVDYGWVITKLPKGSWNRWGQMMQHFYYDVPAVGPVGGGGSTAPEPPVRPGRPLLKSGSRGAAVEELQLLLAAAGFDPGSVDGDFGPKTEAAVLKFQGANGLEADGIVGTLTWAALLADKQPDNDPVDLPMLDKGSRGEAVKRLQLLLNQYNAQLGVTLVVDGSFGPKTDAAVRAYQKAHGLEVDGIVGPKTWAALLN